MQMGKVEFIEVLFKMHLEHDEGHWAQIVWLVSDCPFNPAGIR